MGWAAVTQLVWDTSFRAGCPAASGVPVGAPAADPALAATGSPDAGPATDTTMPTMPAATTTVIRRTNEHRAGLSRPRDPREGRAGGRADPRWAAAFGARLQPPRGTGRGRSQAQGRGVGCRTAKGCLVPSSPRTAAYASRTTLGGVLPERLQPLVEATAELAERFAGRRSYPLPGRGLGA